MRINVLAKKRVLFTEEHPFVYPEVSDEPRQVHRPFVVWVKNGGTGYVTGGPIARAVLNTIMQND